MKALGIRAFATLFALLTATTSLGAEETPEQAAMRVLDEFLAAFNAEDLERWRQTLHYPHVRIASGTVSVAESPEAYGSPETFERLRATGWRRSHWGQRRVVHAGQGKVHVAVTFTRYGENNAVIGAFESLYVVTRQNGRWGVQARSSFAP